MLYDRLGNPLGELAEADVFEAILREEINGEHSLEITTTRVLDKGIRLLYEDGRSKWREFVVAGVDAEHASGNRAIGTYYCVWSVQQDLQGVTVSVMPGVQSPTTAALALTSLLSTTSRWTRGTVTQTTTGGASMYDRSAWEALSTLVEVWGGEIDATIEIGTQSGVIGRAVDLYAAQGEQTAMRRFDFGADLLSVKRTLADDPLFCRISPRGKGEQTDTGGYGRKITIESVNSGRDWLEYAPMVDAAKLPDGNGGYEYPTLIVENSSCETPASLKTWAQSVIAQYCTPKVTYEVDVVQAGIEGVDATGVSLGDAVQVVDRKFGGDGIRVQGRVRSITTDLLNERDITIVIGDAEESISSKFAKVDKSLSAVNNDLTVMSTAEYIDNLLDRINTEINATGGYTYIVPGNGILTFDVAVADPLNPVEASQVVEVKGGSIRIANSKTAQGAWEWKTVFTSGHIAANLVTAAQLTAGYIGSASSGNYWDLDSGYMRVSGDIALGGLNNTNGILKVYDASGAVVCQLDKDGAIVKGSITNVMDGHKSGAKQYAEMSSFPGYDVFGNQTTFKGLRIYSVGEYYDNTLMLEGASSTTMNSSSFASILSKGHLELQSNASSMSDHVSVQLRKTGTFYVSSSSGNGKSFSFDGTELYVGGNLKVAGKLTVNGVKSRICLTDSYGERLLYAYETPTPMFGDVGSGVIGEDGLCYVEIDDVFSETARTNISYQVFLQACGQGELYVIDKSSMYFVVSGTPGLAFDWELKAKQTGFEHLRLDDLQLSEAIEIERDFGINVDEAYSDELNYCDEIERTLYEAA